MQSNIIKENDLFLVTTADGMVPDPAVDAFGYGLFTKDTRVLSQLQCALIPDAFTLVSGDCSANYEAKYHYINKEYVADGMALPRESIRITRTQLVDGTSLYEEWTATNYGDRAQNITIQFTLTADCADMFEVRGYTQDRPAGVRELYVDERGAMFRYTASDEVITRTRCTWMGGSAQWQRAGDQQSALCTVTLRVPAKGQCTGVLVVVPSVGEEPATVSSQEDGLGNVATARRRLQGSYTTWMSEAPKIAGDTPFEVWYARGLQDIRMLITDIGYGPFPVAGVPWYAVPFGRDSLIAALQLLCIHPEIARGTLMTMAAFQGDRVDVTRDEQPGKIMHELRAGELTRTGRVPFGPYYGTIDATPLFLVLAAEYFHWTGDEASIRKLLPHVDRALTWMETFGDRDGDQFIEYVREADRGISNQGWKDSGDSIVHKDGSLAEAPIALCEVQGYAYRAYEQWARIFEHLGYGLKAQHCREKADALRCAFSESFWIPESESVALALDGAKRRVESVSSNMGHVLWSDILSPAQAVRVADRTLQPDMSTGFGIRTLAASEVAYNPLSYHNGSVWPHDTSIVLDGMRRIGHREGVRQIADGLLRAAQQFPLSRLPELYTGYSVAEEPSPIPYPVSCSPQAWAAATPCLTLTSLLGLQPSVIDRVITLHPTLPSGVDQLTVEGLAIADGHLDVRLLQTADGAVAIAVLRNTTGLRLEIKPY